MVITLINQKAVRQFIPDATNTKQISTELSSVLLTGMPNHAACYTECNAKGHNFIKLRHCLAET